MQLGTFEMGDALQAQAVPPSQELLEELNRLDADAVAAKLADNSHEVVNGACWALAAQGEAGKRFSDSIIPKLKDPKTRYNAVCALSSLGVVDDDFIKSTIGCLSDSDVGTRVAAISALRKSAKLYADCSEVSKLLKGTDVGIRCAACLALGGMGHQKSAGQISDLLKDTAEDSSWLASAMGGASSRPPAQVRKLRCAAIAALGMLREQSYASRIVDLTTDSDWEVRACAVEALGNMGDAGLDRAGKLASCLDDDTFPVRARACEALGKLDASQQVDRLADMLNDNSPAVRIEALKAIAAMSDSSQKYLAEVAEHLSDPMNSVKGAAARALAKMGESAFAYASAIAGFLVDKDPFLRLAALDALPKMGNYGTAFAEDISLLLEDPEGPVRALAVEAIGDMNIQTYSLGIRALADDPDKNVAISAQKVLANTGWSASEERVDHE